MRIDQDPTATVALGVASLHGSGYVREAAVDALAARFDGAELPFLLIRLNDWVSFIRDSATKAVLLRMRADYAVHFFRNLPLVLRLRTCGRNRHTPVVDAVANLLRSPSGVAYLSQGISSSDRWTRRECYRLAEESPEVGRLTVFKLAIANNDPVLRLWAARGVADCVPPTELEAVLDGLLRDRFAPVRAEALTAFARRHRGRARERLEEALLDRSAGVRAAARYLLEEIGERVEYAAIYRVALGSKSILRCRTAISGLGETGTEDDRNSLAPFLSHPNPAIRRAAVRGVASLGLERNVGMLQERLEDACPGVSKEAAKALSARVALLDTTRIASLLNNSERPYVREAAFGLLVRLPAWRAGIYILSALSHPDPAITAAAAKAASAWINRTRDLPIGPSADQVLGIREIFAQNGRFLREYDRRELEFLLKSFP